VVDKGKQIVGLGDGGRFEAGSAQRMQIGTCSRADESARLSGQSIIQKALVKSEWSTDRLHRPSQKKLVRPRTSLEEMVAGQCSQNSSGTGNEHDGE
jgi:hypothetical protein